MTGLHLARRSAMTRTSPVIREGAVVHLSNSDSHAAANLAAIHAAAAEYGEITLDPAGPITPITSTLNLPGGVTLDAGGTMLEVLAQGANAIRCRGVGHQTHPVTGTLPAGSNTFVCPTGGFAVDDWVMVQSTDRINGVKLKSQRGNLRKIVGVVGTTYEVHLPFTRAMSTSVVAAKVTLASPPTLANGGVQMRYPEHSQFRGLVAMEAVLEPTLDGFDITQGGSAGLELYCTVDATITGGTRIHDLLDDESGAGWHREASEPGDPYIPNPRTDGAKQHYGYGIALLGGNIGGLIDDTCLIDFCRHAVTTDQPKNFQVMHPSWHLLAGDPEDFVCEATLENMWSSMVSLHEQGARITFRNATWKNPGRYQNLFGSTNLKEDPNFVGARGMDTLFENLTWTFDVGYPQTKSSGFTADTSTLVADLPRDVTTIRNVLQLGGKTGINTKQDVIVDRFKVVGCAGPAIFVQNACQNFDANDVYVQSVPNPVLFGASASNVATIAPIQFVSTTGTKINLNGTTGNVVTEGTATQATGHT